MLTPGMHAIVIVARCHRLMGLSSPVSRRIRAARIMAKYLQVVEREVKLTGAVLR